MENIAFGLALSDLQISFQSMIGLPWIHNQQQTEKKKKKCLHKQI